MDQLIFKHYAVLLSPVFSHFLKIPVTWRETHLFTLQNNKVEIREKYRKWEASEKNNRLKRGKPRFRSIFPS